MSAFIQESERIPRGEKLIIAIKERDRLKINNLNLCGDGREILKVWDPTLKNGQGDYKEAQFYVGMPEEVVSLLPGSVILPDAFLNSLGYEDSREDIAREDIAKKLTSIDLGSFDDPTFCYSAKDHDFSLRVLHGSANTHAKEISKLAKDALGDPNGFTPERRAQYQKEVFEATGSILAYKSDHLFRIVEDCLASGDSIVGILTTLARMTKIGELEQLNSVRIDVAVATTQGVFLLKEFARQNGIKLDINVGYLAYGLSEGIPVQDKEHNVEVRDHANYIVYPLELAEEMGLAEFEYVVGDMGDAFKSMDNSFDERCPWNKLRCDDQHNDNKASQNELFKNNEIDPLKPTILFLANGGWAMRAFLRYIKIKDENADLFAEYNELVVRASRTWSSDPQFGYGVAINMVPEGTLVFLQYS